MKFFPDGMRDDGLGEKDIIGRDEANWLIEKLVKISTNNNKTSMILVGEFPKPICVY